jgi:hypothetical protein
METARVGFGGEASYRLGLGPIQGVQARAGYSLDLADEGSTFVLNGAGETRLASNALDNNDAVTAGAGVLIAATSRLQAVIDYDGRFGDGITDHMLTARAKFSF